MNFFRKVKSHLTLVWIDRPVFGGSSLFGVTFPKWTLHVSFLFILIRQSHFPSSFQVCIWAHLRLLFFLHKKLIFVFLYKFLDWFCVCVVSSSSWISSKRWKQLFKLSVTLLFESFFSLGVSFYILNFSSIKFVRFFVSFQIFIFSLFSSNMCQSSNFFIYQFQVCNWLFFECFRSRWIIEKFWTKVESFSITFFFLIRSLFFKKRHQKTTKYQCLKDFQNSKNHT